MTAREMSYESVSKHKTDIVIGLLISLAEGPKEAYGILTTCIYRLNFEMNETPGSVDELCAEITISLRSITALGKDLQ